MDGGPLRMPGGGGGIPPVEGTRPPGRIPPRMGGPYPFICPFIGGPFMGPFMGGPFIGPFMGTGPRPLAWMPFGGGTDDILGVGWIVDVGEAGAGSCCGRFWFRVLRL